MLGCTDALLGVAIGDALGVPVEFKSREELDQNPVTGMRAYSVHNQPAGTWSDDSSLTFCLAESLTNGYNSFDIGDKFAAWLYNNYWSARGNVFDVGNTTRIAIDRLASKSHFGEGAGPSGDATQGNGSLMRILPLAFYSHANQLPVQGRWDITRRVSSITHGHVNCSIACFIYLEIAECIFRYKYIGDSITQGIESSSEFLRKNFTKEQLAPFERILSQEILNADRNNIKSSGYVVATLEAAIWCLWNTDSFKEAVLKAVNLGDDSDTTGAVVGGLAGLCHGINAPIEWIDVLARNWDIFDLGKRLEMKMKTYK